MVPTVTDEAVSPSTLELIAGNRCISVAHKSRISPSLLVALRRSGVRYISTRSVGYNHIDLPTAERLGISVGNVAYSPDSVADYTLMLMLMAVRDAKTTLSRAQSDDYRLSDVRGRELRDLTVGVVGTGRIGAAVIERLGGFGARVLASDSRPETSATYVGLDALLRESDIVTLHTPLNAQTYHLLDQRRIDLMRTGAIVVNTGRGSLVDTDALLSALEEGRIGGAALDVLEGEEGVFYFDRSRSPIGDPRLLRLQQLPNVVITPHTAYFTDHALSDVIENTLVNCMQFLREDHG